MFRKLHDTEKKYNQSYKNSYAQKSANRLKHKQISYSKMHKVKKVSPTEQMNYRILSNDSYIYQGEWFGDFKHGEGIAFFKNGTVVVGHWTKDLLHGRSLFFTPFGGMISAEFISGKLNGWVISQYKDKVMFACLYFEDKVDGARITFQKDHELWVASYITNDGKLIKMSNAQKGKRNKLPTFVDSDEFKQIFEEIMVQKNYTYGFRQIKTRNIGAITKYIGYLNQQQNPSGLGITYSQHECFSGYFESGYLQHLGRMVFENGDIYHGGVTCGEFNGHGIYYSASKNQTIVMNSAQGEQTQMVEQQQGYFLLDFQLKVGDKLVIEDKIQICDSLQNILKVLQKYYHQHQIEIRRSKDQFSNISEQQSENKRISQIDQDLQQDKNAPMKVKWAQDSSGHSENVESIELERRSKSKQTYSPSHKKQNQFFSIVIKENEDPEEVQRFRIRNPNQSENKKEMFDSKPSYMNLNSSKSLDISNLTFRGNKQKVRQPSEKNKNPYLQIQIDERQDQYKIYNQQKHGNDQQIYRIPSEHNTSVYSNMEEKTSGVIKKSNFRRKIFQ